MLIDHLLYNRTKHSICKTTLLLQYIAYKYYGIKESDNRMTSKSHYAYILHLAHISNQLFHAWDQTYCLRIYRKTHSIHNYICCQSALCFHESDLKLQYHTSQWVFYIFIRSKSFRSTETNTVYNKPRNVIKNPTQYMVPIGAEKEHIT
jgi:hypothetical protein